MTKILKKLIVPIIIVILFAATYFIVMPYLQRREAKENVFKNFESNLKTLNIKYTKNEINASEFGAWKAYEYSSEDAKVKLYVFNKDSKEYNYGLKNGYIVSKKNNSEYLYAMFYGHCAIYIDDEFPNMQRVLQYAYSAINKYENGTYLEKNN